MDSFHLFFSKRERETFIRPHLNYSDSRYNLEIVSTWHSLTVGDRSVT